MNDNEKRSNKPVFVMCYCTGECPGFQSLLHADLESAKRFTDLVPRIPPGQVRAVASAPLNDLTFDPDIVVVYDNTSQAMRLVQAYLWKHGGRVGFSTGGKYSLCADTLADTFNKQDLSLAVPCFGDRKTGPARGQRKRLKPAKPMASRKCTTFVWYSPYAH